MKLLVQHPHAEGEISGVLTSVNELMPALVRRQGIHPRLFSSKEASWRSQWRAVRDSDALMLNSNCMALLLCACLLRRPTLLKLHYPQYQTVHWHYEPMSFVRRIGTELRHLWRLDTSTSYRAASLGRLAMRTLVALLARRVCACSGFSAAQASLPRPVSVLRNPLAVVPGQVARTLQELDQPLRFVFVGRLSDEKGWATLLDAAARLRRSGREFAVDIVGDGPDRERLLAALASDNLAANVHWLGRRSPVDVQTQLAGALAAVVPSRVQEQAGYVAVEAAAHQVASIVSNAGGLPETAGPACPRFEIDDTQELMCRMASWLDDPEQALAAGRDAYLRACDEFSPDRIACELLELLRR